ncbi:Actin-related protein 5 [Vitis vinifera]|uniref:Actin-related protein 5 n=1 Tax=Vitis vinifera TaxID=29760 RepID=A0A438JXP5_VITVI|nr:Actin-related protein 5 [Vitis vinifera]
MPFVSQTSLQSDYTLFSSNCPIVIDNGGSNFRIGWAGETDPRIIFRNIVQRPRHKATGETVTIVGDHDPALMKYFDCTRSSPRSAFDSNVVYQFEIMEYILDYGFERMGADGSQDFNHALLGEVTCKDMRHGGLGLRYLKDFNHALLGKWLWRFPIERESLWRKVIVGKFGEVQGGWTTREVRESYGTGLWKDIRKGWEEFFLRTRIHIGNGRRTRFWWDMWVGDSKLKDLFPLLFRIAANNSAIVADLWGRQEGGGGGWEVHFRRPFQDWELEEVNRFLSYISAVRVQEGEDFLVWKIERKGTFKVNSYYRSLKEDNSPLFPVKEVWGSYAPLRTRFFAWEAVWGKISTIDMLMRRGWSIANRCNLCKENEETANHILIHCGKTRDLWNLLFSSFGVVWVLPDSVRNLLLEWKMKGMGKKRSVVWKMAPICLFWCIWGERNRRTFLEEEMTNTS